MLPLQFSKLPVPPSINRAYRRQRFYTKEARDYWGVQYDIVEKMRGMKPLSGQVQVTATYYLRTTKKGRIRRDVDGSNKMLLDVFSGLAYDDDNQVMQITTRKRPSPTGEEWVDVCITEYVDVGD